MPLPVKPTGMVQYGTSAPAVQFLLAAKTRATTRSSPQTNTMATKQRACINRAPAAVFTGSIKAAPPRQPHPAQPSLPSASRRSLLLLPLVPALLAAEAATPKGAQASAFGEAIAGWWKDAQRSNSIKLLAPIKVAQQKLSDALALMQGASNPAALKPVLAAVRTSSLNCYVFEALPDDSFETRASLASQAMQISDPCTFRLIVKNITGLSTPAEKQEGEELVASIVLSYQKLDGELEAAIQGGSSEAAARAERQLAATMAMVSKLEAYVEGVLA